jgi:hypothetical protein
MTRNESQFDLAELGLKEATASLYGLRSVPFNLLFYLHQNPPVGHR